MVDCLSLRMFLELLSTSVWGSVRQIGEDDMLILTATHCPGSKT